MKYIKSIIITALLMFASNMTIAQVTITMEQDGGVYKVPCVVNGAKMKFIFDTGAATVCLSESMAEYLMDNDYISKDDIMGLGTSQVADGRIVDHVKINLRDIEIAGLHLQDVEAVVVEGQRAPLLLGQTAIQKLGRVSIEGNKLTIDNGTNNDVDVAIECLRSLCRYSGGLSDNITFEKFKALLHDKAQLKEYFDFTRKNYPSLFDMSWDIFVNEVSKLLRLEDNKLVSLSDLQLQKQWMLTDKAKKFEDQEQYLLAAEAREECYNFKWGGNQKDMWSTFEGYTYSHQGEDEYKVGINYYHAKEYKKALKWLARSADKGDRDAQFQLGWMYSEGIGVEQNYSTAVYWYRKAAENNHAKAQCNLGSCYANGTGVAQSISEGFKWTLKAYKNGDDLAKSNMVLYFNEFKSLAENGNKNAVYYTAYCYYEGYGTSKNYYNALKWFKIGAERGDDYCQNFLAIMYDEGKGTNVDKISAIYWFKKSAEQGNRGAQMNLAQRYKLGIDVEQDYLSAYHWYYLAAEHEDMEAECELGKMLLYGQGVKTDLAKALMFFEKSAQKGYEEAYYILGNLYWQGFGVEQNYKTAVDWWYKCSRSFEDERGIDYLIAIAWKEGKGREKNNDLYLSWMSYCTNDINGLNALAYDFAIGQNGWKKQISQALIVINEAIKLKPDDPNYYDSKGEFYSMQKNYEKAKEMWNKVKLLDASFYSKNNTELNKYILKQGR